VVSLPLIASAGSCLIWIYLTFFRGAFWHLRAFDGDSISAEKPDHWPRIAVIVPARDEAESIERAVRSLLQQDYPGEYHVYLVDDHSEDGTAKLAERAAETAELAGRLTILQAAPLQKGWTGKLWALQQGVERTAQDSPEYFWFTDADIEHAPDTLRRLVSRAVTGNVELTSLMAFLQAKSFPQRLLIPPFLYFFLKLYPPQWVADPDLKMAGAAGGCILLRKPTLQRIGGLAAIRAEVIDDCAMARAVKHSGGTIWLGVTRKSVSVRSSESYGEIVHMIARTAFTQLRYSPTILLGTSLGMFLTYLSPVIFSFSMQASVWRLSLTAWALMTITYLVTLRFYGLSALWAPLLPVAAVFYSYATWLSAVRYWRGRGGQWKGRSQAPGGSERT
jgi:hopene-associated glycosyltransferase HpnB